jgi:hypothetical protein
MKTIHFDETGTLSFNFTKEGTSDYFITAFLISDNPKSVQTIVKNVFRTMSKANRKHSHGVLHAYYQRPEIRTRLLRRLAFKDIQIAAMVYNKRNVLIVEDVHAIYNSMVIALINRLYAEGVISAGERRGDFHPVPFVF